MVVMAAQQLKYTLTESQNLKITELMNFMSN